MMNMNFFTAHTDRICIICSYCAYDITLTAQITSCYVCHTVTNWDCITNYTSMYSSRKETVLVCLDLVHTVFPLFSTINSVKEISPYCLPTLLFNEQQTSHRCIMSSFMFNVLPFHCHSCGFSQFCSHHHPKHNRCLMVTKMSTCTCIVVFCDIVIQPRSLESQGKGKPVGQGREDTSQGFCKLEFS
jgi:hypothetical protein